MPANEAKNEAAANSEMNNVYSDGSWIEFFNTQRLTLTHTHTNTHRVQIKLAIEFSFFFVNFVTWFGFVRKSFL